MLRNVSRAQEIPPLALFPIQIYATVTIIHPVRMSTVLGLLPLLLIHLPQPIRLQPRLQRRRSIRTNAIRSKPFDTFPSLFRIDASTGHSKHNHWHSTPVHRTREPGPHDPLEIRHDHGALVNAHEREQAERPHEEGLRHPTQGEKVGNVWETGATPSVLWVMETSPYGEVLTVVLTDEGADFVNKFGWASFDVDLHGVLWVFGEQLAEQWDAAGVGVGCNGLIVSQREWDFEGGEVCVIAEGSR